MKIRKVCPSPVLSSPSFAATATSTPNAQPHPRYQRSPDSPRVMVSRINSRFTANVKEKKINHHQDQDLGNIEEMNSTRITPANQSLIGGWREEEKIMPLKKRRISFETDLLIIEKEEIKTESNIIVIDDMGINKVENKKWVVSDDDGAKKMEEPKDLRCVRRDERKWRYKKREVEGHSYCDHHLNKLTRASHKHRKAAAIINAAAAAAVVDDDEHHQEDDGEFDNENKINGKVKAKATRSMNSLLRETVPLLPLYN